MDVPAEHHHVDLHRVNEVDMQQLARKRRGDGHGQVHNGDVHGERGDLHAQALSHDRLEQAPGGEA